MDNERQFLLDFKEFEDMCKANGITDNIIDNFLYNREMEKEHEWEKFLNSKS